MVKKITYFIVAIIFFAGLFWLLSQPPKSNTESSIQPNNATAETADKYQNYPVYDDPDLVFYWGNGCPHCENVEKWLDENNSDQKLKINYKEVYYNQDNQADLLKTVQQYCSDLSNKQEIGVPTGFDPVDKKCIQGDAPLIEFLSAKLAK